MSTLKVNNITDLGDDAVVTSGVLDTLAVPAGGILQVVSTTKTDTFSTTSTTFTDVTGLSITVTPSFTNSKILVFASVNVNAQSTDIIGVRLLRDATAIALGDAAGSRSRAFAAPRMSNDHFQDVSMVSFLDSPSTTSATTYKIQLKGGGSAIYVNRAHVDTDNSFLTRTVSTITIMEVAG